MCTSMPRRGSTPTPWTARHEYTEETVFSLAQSATSVKSADVLERFADGRAKRVAFAIDAGMAKDEYELDYVWTGDERVDWTLVRGEMMRAQRVLPDDFWALGTVQALAELCCEVEPRLTDEEMATLIGVGAVLIRLGREETIAGIKAGIAIFNAKGER